MPTAEQRFVRLITDDLRTGITWEEIWNGPDQGLIACWECGRRTKHLRPTLADSALRGELPSLPFKGGFKKKPKEMKRKWGTLHYLAMWRGLRGESLDIGLADEHSIVCAKLNIEVTFTFDREKYLSNAGDDDSDSDGE